MPHSSGGGSHSGGSHGGGGSGGGGSRSSRRRRGYANDDSISLKPYLQNSPVYFPGAYRYARYHDGDMEYIYSSDSNLNQSGHSKTSLLWLLIYVPFIIMGIFLMSESIHLPKKMESSYSQNVEVIDKTHRVSDQEQSLVEQGASNLFKSTGVPICIVFDNNSSWKPYYRRLENYAYDLYINKYDDEDHWLIVYTDDGVDRQDVNEFSDWYFEGMQGNNTDKYLPEYLTTRFNRNLNRALTDKKNTTGYAFYYALSNMADNASKVAINFKMLPMAVFVNIFIIIHFVLVLTCILHNNRNQHNEYNEYVFCGNDTEEIAKTKEVRCPHCGGMYYKGTVISCPHCGAPLDYINESTYNGISRQWIPPQGFDK